MIDHTDVGVGSFQTQITVQDALLYSGWFREPGAYVLMGGQFGSEGKGLLASVLGEVGGHRITSVTTNAGPNSGHTGYCPYTGERIMTQQIPVSSVVMSRNPNRSSPGTHINSGAIVDPDILLREAQAHPGVRLTVSPWASVITDRAREEEADGGPSKIASTGKGVGAAQAYKIMRDPGSTMKDYEDGIIPEHQPPPWFLHTPKWDWSQDVVLVEVAQGFSLGINSGFWPYCTSRECSVMQALADARIPYDKVRKVASCFRTYPIRVGNTDKGNSGPPYPDQHETSWEELGVEAEFTSVTHRMRRVFTWSWQQFHESVALNRPDVVFLNFAQYPKPGDLNDILDTLPRAYHRAMGSEYEGRRRGTALLTGWGPNNGDVMYGGQL